MTAAPQAPSPKRRWPALAVAAAVALGALGGLSLFTFGYGGGLAYLSDDPAVCANCHVMQEHLDAWRHSSHHRVATCNDCHLSPHPVGQWITKADNGFFHSLAFTTGGYPDPIRIKPRNRAVTQAACLSCHETLFAGHPGPDDRPLCVGCHAAVGHAGRGASGPGTGPLIR